MSGETTPPAGQPTPAQVERAIKFTYAQMMLGAVFGASTGGMFLIGFALQLGASDVLLGLMVTVPQYFVLLQFLAAWLIERGVSRRKITVWFGFVGPLCWLLIAAIPLLGDSLSQHGRFAVLVGVMALVTVAAQFAGNARGSWLGELIPAERRGRFFGYCTMFAGIVGAVFLVIEGRFLDVIRSHGLFAFTGLFFFGALFGLVAAGLNVPQPDCPLPGTGPRAGFGQLLRDTVRNKPFVVLAITHAVLALGGIAGPFNAAYSLRDVGISFFGLGLLNSVGTAALLLTSPGWGKLVDRFGCRPILVFGLLLMAPCPLLWLAVPPGAVHRAYWLLPWGNLVSGIGSGAVSVAISTLIYKMSKPEGRSVQLAAYSAFIGLVGAPMPLIGGWLVSRLTRSGFGIDLRLTFYLWGLFMFIGALIAQRVAEPGASPVRALVFSYFPSRMAGLFGQQLPPLSAPFGGLGRFPAAEKDEGGRMKDEEG